ncbi:NUDIX domain-containing protein [Thermomicrobium sp. 4228-Ro]|uniref:NUDIX domain-containing protein n=1 Tax=Thermomicrobium sp. 4228-Ro TaxID=2993937 RepID=UPI0022495D44|nr:NUDIX domain-containing protein [Thermomicrobium sp. 4228-Ro]MCX2727967.1 NUDIX domain-containing protein [Thermomicrobium sp. 4228-Ro]
MSGIVGHVVAVGGIVQRERAILLVRQRYGPSRGLYLFPGGLVEPGETLDQAVVREVAEETGITAAVHGIVGLRTRCDGDRNDTYVMFLLDWLAGEPQPDGHEIDDARFFTLEELRDPAAPITALSRYVAVRVLEGRCTVQPFAADFDYAAAGRDPATWRLFC